MDAKPGYPLRQTEHRELAVDQDRCPECGCSLDVGYECGSCGYDAIQIVRELNKLKGI